MRLNGCEYQEIADRLGYTSRGAAAQDVQRHLEQLTREPTEELRTLEVLRLDQSLQRLAHNRDLVLETLGRPHVTVSNGRVVLLNDEPIPDDEFVHRAVGKLNEIEDRVLRVGERRARLLGLDGGQEKSADAAKSLLGALASGLNVAYERLTPDVVSDPDDD